MCGIFGIADHDDASRVAKLGLFTLQHRGQESTGISSADGSELYTHKAMGYGESVFTDDVMMRLKGRSAVGHTRYSTAGDSSEQNAQPIVAKWGSLTVSLCHNGTLNNYIRLKQRLEQDGAIFQSTSDSEVILHLLARAEKSDLLEALTEVFRQLEGAFSAVMLFNDGTLVGVRDPRGFRPLCLGEINGAYALASESCVFSAFEEQGGSYTREIEPGEIVIIRGDELKSDKPLSAPRLAKCIFEPVYFSRADSNVFGRTVVLSRDLMGRILAEEVKGLENKLEADIVVPVPDVGLVAANSFAQESGIPMAFGLIRNNYSRRTFIEPETIIRLQGVKVKLNPVEAVLSGKRVILIDDSIVRANTSRGIVRKVRAAGATAVYVLICCPPIVSPCFYGIDIPTKRELIAARNSVEDIRKFIEADFLYYLSLPGLLRAVAADANDYCTACFTGMYPTQLTPELEAELSM